jgi:hypothetical protein
VASYCVDDGSLYIPPGMGRLKKVPCSRTLRHVTKSYTTTRHKKREEMEKRGL